MKKWLSLLFLFLPLYAQDIYIIIHGTWGQSSAWHKPGGDFYDQLAKVVIPFGGYVQFLIWTGNNTHTARMQAAQELVELLHQFSLSDQFILIGHSHGGNVALLVSQLLGMQKSQYRIQKLFLLGTPICEQVYYPDMEIIDHVYNLFSYADMIQPVVGLFQRELPAHQRIANMRVLLNGKEPQHAGLHDPLIAKWLFMIHHDLKMFKYGNFEIFDCNQPGIINFITNDFPNYQIDIKRQAEKDRDERMLHLLSQAIMHDRSFAHLKKRLLPAFV